MQKELFPDFDSLVRYEHRRTHVLERLEEMATAGTLYLTECLQHRAAGLVREVCHGRDIRDRVPREGRHIPRALRNYEVAFRVIPHTVQRDEWSPENQCHLTTLVTVDTIEGVSFKLPPIEVDSMTESEARSHGIVGSIRTHASGGGYVDNVYEAEDVEFSLPLDEAVMCLDRIGKDVKRAKSAKQKLARWKVEEIHPSGNQPEPPKKKSRGRPRKKPVADVEA